MSTSATGSVVDQESGAGLAGLRVFLLDPTQIHDRDAAILDQTVTTSTGSFSLKYAEYLSDPATPGKLPRNLNLTIRLGQLVLKEVPKTDDPSQSTIDFGKIVLPRAEAESWQATLGTGTPSRVTDGNAIRWLADNVDAWGRVAQVIKSASTLDVMQLEIDIDSFNADFRQEKPIIVLDFDPGDAPSGEKLSISQSDDRIERLFLAASQRGVDVRIQIPRMTMDPGLPVVTGSLAVLIAGSLLLLWLAPLTAALIVTGVAAGLVVAGAIGFDRIDQFFHRLFEEPKLSNWFSSAGADASHVRVRELKLRSLFVTHAKVVIDRGKEGVLLGSPFEQVYFDSLQHNIDNPQRGRAAVKGPIHDVSVAVRGPAVGHLQELFSSHWNIADPTDQIAQLPTPAAQTAGDGEFAASVQVVRTLDQMFAVSTKGEKGVLEAYLRAIHFAQRFIYVENQYFNQDDITDALVDALAQNPSLVVILMLNVAPDMNLYPGWQKRAIDRIAQSLGDKTTAAKRFGVFTSWSHSKSDDTHTKPRLVDNYLHTKTAIIDNRWATVGSANLDGASLDYVQYARAATGDMRNTEANLVVFEDAGKQNSAVDALRRRLWGEHLGITDPQSADLADAAGKDWLAVWTQKATEKLTGLQSNLDAVSSVHILPWPSAPFELNASSHAAAKSYLDHLFSPDEQPSDVLESQFDLLKKGPPSFVFSYHP